MTRKIALAWSSGKDSAFALQVLRATPGLEVVELLTTLNGAKDRVAMHGVRRVLVEAQAHAIGLPLKIVSLPQPCSNAAYESAMVGACATLATAGITAVAFGDIHLADVRAYREAQMQRAGLACLFPLWQRESAQLAQALIDEGIAATLVCLDPKRLDAAFLGRRYDAELVAALPAGVDACGENGEFHTFCWAAPSFAAPVRVRAGATVESEGLLYLDLEPAVHSEP